MRKLKPKELSLLKLVAWSMMVVWMVFFFALSLAIARTSARVALLAFGFDKWGQTAAWVLPVWIVFTALLIIFLVGRWTNKKLGRKND